VIAAAELLALATFRDEKVVGAFPRLGFERTSAPFLSFCGIDCQPIRSLEPVYRLQVVLNTGLQTASSR